MKFAPTCRLRRRLSPWPPSRQPIRTSIRRLKLCGSALSRVANYELEPSLQKRLLDLGDRKEFLGEAEYDELMALVDFTRKRTIESLEAKLALDRVRQAFRSEPVLSNPEARAETRRDEDGIAVSFAVLPPWAFRQ
jgi:hypothetical protein